jgi:hypothetical protein
MISGITKVETLARVFPPTLVDSRALSSILVNFELVQILSRVHERFVALGNIQLTLIIVELVQILSRVHESFCCAW